ncbi:MAG: hypothetical protein JW934_04725 [Anaerolineae bacterium]|nr:hypothetical protein [Anaerolineae bacterium]
MTEKTKLIDHRRALAANPDAYTYEFQETHISRLVNTLVPRIRNAGYCVTPSKSFDVLARVIKLLFQAQDNRPFFHVEGTELPLCWNSPKDWDKNYIKYEWGHLKSRNQLPEQEFDLENLGLYSARCNQHIQTSLHIEELMVYGGILAQRISNVLTARRMLFESEEWNKLVKNLREMA